MTRVFLVNNLFPDVVWVKEKIKVCSVVGSVTLQQHLLMQISFNPRLTKLFFVTRLTKGGCYNPLPRFSEPNPLWNWFWYQKVDMDLLYPYIPKWVQSAKALRSYDVIKTSRTWKFRYFAKNRRKFKISLYKFWISEFHRVFCLYKRKMVIPTCSVSFSFIVCRYFSKWWIILFLKLKRLQQPPLTLWLWGLTLPPGKVVPPFFFHENDRKGCKRDYLYAHGKFL